MMRRGLLWTLWYAIGGLDRFALRLDLEDASMYLRMAQMEVAWKLDGREGTAFGPAPIKEAPDA